MKRILIAILMLAWAGISEGAVYCVKQGGTVAAASKANAAVADAAACTAINSAGGALSMVTARTLSGMADGDSVVFSAKDINGNDNSYTDYMTIPQGGTSTNINYLGIADGTSSTLPLLAIATNVYPGCIRTNTKSNIYVSGFRINYTGANADDAAVIIQGTSSGVTINNITSNMGTYGYHVISGGAITVTNVTISNFTGTASGAAKNPIYLYGSAYTNTTLSNVSITTGYGVYIKNTAGLTISNLTLASTTVQALKLESLSGVVTIDTVNSTPTSEGTLAVLTTVFGAGSTIANVAQTGGGGPGASFTTVTGTVALNNYTYGGSTYPFYANNSSGITVNTATSTAGTSWSALGSTDNTTFNDVANGSTQGFVVQNTANNITYNRCSSTATTTGAGFIVKDTAHGVTYNDSIARNGTSDGFLVQDNAYNVTWNRCRASGNGAKTSTSDGDGFTTHTNNYNIYCNYCISDNNTASGYAMTGASSGHIYNSIAYANAGDWSVEGGGKLKQVRGGFYFALTGNNATTGTSWVMKNNIGKSNYPREIYLDATGKVLVDFDYNLYSEDNTASLATIDGASTNINWATYHGTYEANSKNGNPSWASVPASLTTLSASDYRLLSPSPAINAGVNLCTAAGVPFSGCTGAGAGTYTDYAGNTVPFLGGKVDIGAFEFQSGDPWTIGGGGKFITFPRFPLFPSIQ